MKRIRMRPGKIVYISDEVAARAAEAFRKVSLTKEEVSEAVRQFPRNARLVMVGRRVKKPSLRRPASTARVLAKVRQMLDESGDSARASRFDVERWVEVWMRTRQPALSGRTPAEMIQLHDSWDRVEALLEQMRDGGFG